MGCVLRALSERCCCAVSALLQCYCWAVFPECTIGVLLLGATHTVAMCRQAGRQAELWGRALSLTALERWGPWLKSQKAWLNGTGLSQGLLSAQRQQARIRDREVKIRNCEYR